MRRGRGRPPLSEEEKALRKQKLAEKRKLQREEESPGAKSARLARDADRKRQARAYATAEVKAKMEDKARAERERRAAMSPTTLRLHRAQDAARKRLKRQEAERDRVAACLIALKSALR